MQTSNNLRDLPEGVAEQGPPSDAPHERFVLQICLSNPGEEQVWDPVQSFASPRESLAGCSGCVEEIQLMLGIDPIPGPEPGVARLRVWDRLTSRVILLEEEDGGLRWDASAFPDGIPGEPETEMGININDSTRPWTEWILDGLKTVETRDVPSLRPYVGMRVGIVRTRKGPATLLGYVTIKEEKRYVSPEEFELDFEKHRVPMDSPGFTFGYEKFGYVLEDPQRTQPQVITTRGVVARRLPKSADPLPAPPIRIPSDAAKVAG